MPGDSLHDFCKKKAFEVSYALFRVAGAASSKKSFSEHIESQALELLKAAAAHDYRSAAATLSAIEYFLRLGVEGGLVSPTNTQIIISEANNLNAAMIAAFGNAATVAELNLEGIFSPFEPPTNEPVRERSVKKEKSVKETNVDKEINAIEREDLPFLNGSELESDGRNPAIDTMEMKQDFPNNAAIVAEYVTKMRQSTVLNRIKEFDNCRLRDVQEVLPDISERTLRYDLQSLVEQGVIERIGSGGAGSYYRVRQTSSQVI